jgi:uncharacterized protein (TIGR00730 family)
MENSRHGEFGMKNSRQRIRRRVCVFCGSSDGSRDEYREAAIALGRYLGEARLGLVYGGAHVGLMGVLADSALASGSEVIGVIPRTLAVREVAHRRLTKLYVVETMHQRKAKMVRLSDAFVALPGGFGTLDEFFEVLTWSQLGIHRKPSLLVNTCGYFDGLLQFLDTAVEQGFLRPENRALIHQAHDSGETLPMLSRLWEQP